MKKNMEQIYNLVNGITENLNELKEMYKEYTDELSTYDLAQQDILHYVEFNKIDDGFEALEIIDKLNEIRGNRREIKDNCELLSGIISLINGNQLIKRTNKLKKKVNEHMDKTKTYKVKVLTDMFGETLH